MNRLISFILLIFMLAEYPMTLLTAQDYSEADLWESSILELYLDQADRQHSFSEWHRYAEMGILAAVASWEQEELLKQADEKFRDITEQRFAQYVVERSLQDIELPGNDTFLQAVSDSNFAYLYEHKEDGSILLDDNKQAVFKRIEGLFDSNEVSGEYTLWKNAIQAAQKKTIEEWYTNAQAGLPELANLSEQQIKLISDLYIKSIEEHAQQMRAEMDRLYAIEESRFLSYRIYDHRSLEYETQQQTAQYVASALVTETELKLQEGMESLQTQLDVMAQTDHGQPGIEEGMSWQENFRVLMEEGFAAWDEAEEKLLMERISLEQDAGQKLFEAEEAWAKAFEQFSFKRSEWESEITNLIENGSKLWKSLLDQNAGTVVLAIEDAKAELVQNKENRVASAQSRIENLTGMLLESIQMIKSARDSWNYLMDTGDDGKLGNSDYTSVALNSDAMRNATFEVYFNLLADTHPVKQYGDTLLTIVKEGGDWRYNILNDAESGYHSRLDSYLETLFFSLDDSSLRTVNNNGVSIHSDFITGFTSGFESQTGHGNRLLYLENQLNSQIAELALVKTRLEDNAIKAGNKAEEEYRASQRPTGHYSVSWATALLEVFEAINKAGYDAYIAADTTVYEQEKRIKAIKELYEQYLQAINQLVGFFKWVKEGMNDGDDILLSNDKTIVQLNNTELPFHSSELNEALNWCDTILPKYINYAKEAQNSLASQYGIVIMDDASVQNSSYFNSDGSLSEVLALSEDPHAWENMYLDEYQVELLKAQAYGQYYDNLVSVSSAVMAYAEESSSNKVDASVTKKEYSDAEKEYLNALETYNTALGQLQQLSGNIAEMQSDIDSLRQQIQDAQNRLKDIQQELTSFIIDVYNGDPEGMKEVLQSQYRQYLGLIGLAPDSDSTLGNAMADYLTALNNFSQKQQYSLLSNKLKNLMFGSDAYADEMQSGDETLSLVALKERLEKAELFIPGYYTDLSESSSFVPFFVYVNNELQCNPELDKNSYASFAAYIESQLGISPSHVYYSRFIKLFTDFTSIEFDAEPNSQPDSTSQSDERRQMKILFEMQQLVDDIKGQYAHAYALRIRALQFLQAPSLHAFVHAIGWDESEYKGKTEGELYNYIVDLKYSAEINITDIQAEIEKDIYSLQTLLADIPADETDTHPVLNISEDGSLNISDSDRQCMFLYSLIKFFNNDYNKVVTEISARISALEALKDTISPADSLSHANIQNELRHPTYTENREHQFLHSYLQGLSALNVGGISFAARDYTPGNQGLSELVKHSIMFNPALSSVAEQIGIEKLEKLLLDNGLLQVGLNENGEPVRSFTHPSEIIINIQKEAENVLDAIAMLEEIQRRYSDISKLLNPGVNTAVNGYFDALTEELAFVYAESILEDSFAGENLNSELEKLGNKIKALNSQTQSISKRLICQYFDTDDSGNNNSYKSLQGQVIAHVSYDILEHYFDKNNTSDISELINNAFNADYLLEYSDDIRLQVLKTAVSERVQELRVATELLAKGDTVPVNEIAGVSDKEVVDAVSSLDFVVYDPEAFYNSISYNSITKKAYFFDTLYAVQYLKDLLVAVEAAVVEAAADPDTMDITFSGDGQAIIEKIISLNSTAPGSFQADVTRTKKAERFLQSIFTSYSTDITYESIVGKIEDSLDSMIKHTRKLLDGTTSLSNPEVYRNLFGAALADYIFEKQYNSDFTEYVYNVLGITDLALPSGGKASQRDFEAIIYENKNAERFYIKQRILAGEELVDIKLVNSDLHTELKRFEALKEIQQTYLEISHGDLYAFIESEYANFAEDYEFYLEAKARVSSRESITPYDSYFIAVSNGGQDRSENKLAVLKMLQEREVGSDASSRTGGTYSRTAALLAELNREMNNEYEILAGDQISRRLRAQFYNYHENARRVLGYEGEEYIQENWTYYLTDNYLLPEQERLNSEAEGSSYTYQHDALYANSAASDAAGYVNDITIGNEGDENDIYDSLTNPNPGSLTMHDRPDNNVSRKDRYLYDLGLRVLEQAAFLTQALECVRSVEKAPSWYIGSQVNSSSDNISAEALYQLALSAKDDQFDYAFDTHLKDAYEQAAQNLQSTQSQLRKLRMDIANRGARIAVIEASLRNSDGNIAENTVIAKKMADLRNQLYDARDEIGLYQNQWNILINGDGTDSAESYSFLLNEYENQYNKTEGAFDALEKAKWELKRKEVIMEYATAGYLSYNDPLLAESDNPEALELTEEQKEAREFLKDQINAVNISTLHKRYLEKQSRAHAVIDVLIELNNSKGKNTVTSTSMKNGVHSQSYLAYYNRYMQHLKERILLDKMNNLVLKQIAMQETKVQKAFHDWSSAKNEMFGTYDFTEAFTVEDFGLLEKDYTALTEDEALIVDRIHTTFGSDTGSHDYERLKEYFTVSASYLDSDAPSFQKDLDNYIDQINSYDDAERQYLIRTFTFAQQYERFLDLLKKDDLIKQYSEMSFDEFWKAYINGNKESRVYHFFTAYLAGNNKWGDDIRAREKLVTSMKENYDFISLQDPGQGQDIKELYSLFKLISGTSSMTVSERFSGQTGTANHRDYENYVCTELVNRELQESVIESADNYTQKETVLWIAAAVISWMWWMAPVTALLVGLALDAHHNANIRYDEADLLYNRFIKPNQENQEIYSNVLSDNMSAIKTTYTAYCEEMKILQMLKGASVQNWVADEVEVLKSYLNKEGDTPSESVLFELMVNSVKTAYNTANKESVNLVNDLSAIGYENSDESVLEDFLISYKNETADETIDALTSGAGYLSKLVETSRAVSGKSARDFDAFLLNSDGSVSKSLILKQADTMAEYDTALNAFYAFSSDHDQQDSSEYAALKETLKAAAEKAFIHTEFSRREHNMLMYEGLRDIFTPISEDLNVSLDVKAELIEEQKKYLTGQYVKNNSIATYRHSMLEDRYDAFFDVKNTHFDIVLIEYQEQMNRWEMSIQAILARGQLEWSDAERRLRREYNNWLIEVQDGYNDTKRAWDDKYVVLLDKKEGWMNTVSIQATQIGDMDVLHNFGDAAAAAISMAEDAAEAVALPELDTLLEADPDKILENTVGDSLTLLDTLMENARFISGRIDFYKPVIFTSFNTDQFTSVEAMNAIREFQNDLNREYHKSIITLELERLADRIQTAEENFGNQIAAANKGVKNQLRHTLGSDGYVLNGNNWTRKGVTGSNIIDGLETEVFSISDYSDFKIPDIDLSDSFNKIANLNTESLSTNDLSVEALEDIMVHVMHDISDETARIFGKSEDDVDQDIFKDFDIMDTGDESSADTSVKPESKFIQQIEWIEEIVETLTVKDESAHGRGSENATRTIYSKIEKVHTETREVFISPGELGKHVGFAPEFKDTPDFDKSWKQNIKFKGLGEMGHIMGRFIWNKIKEGQGYAEANKPFYEQQLWDDRNTWVEAPTVRGIVDMGVSVATMVATGGPAIFAALSSAGLNLLDDALFTALDVGYGQKSMSEAWINFGIQAGTSAASAALGSLIPGGDTDDWLINGIKSAAKSYTAGIMTSPLQALQYSDHGGISFNSNIIKDSFIGVDLLANTAAAFAMGAAGTGLKAAFAEDGKCAEGLIGIGTDFAGSAARFATYLGSESINGWDYNSFTSAFDDMGGLSFNILNLGALLDFAYTSDLQVKNGNQLGNQVYRRQLINSLSGAGLFELNITSKGINGKIGMGGMNLAGNMYSLGKGLYMKQRINEYISSGTTPNGVTAEALRMGYAHGDRAFEDTLWRITGGKDILTLAESPTAPKPVFNPNTGRIEHTLDPLAETIADTLGNRTIKLFKNAFASDFDLATVLSHEAWRNGIDDGPEHQSLETRNAAKAHMKFAATLENAYKKGINLNSLFAAEARMYNDAMETDYTGILDRYIDSSYDSSQDYWRLTADADGRLRLYYDGYEDIVDEYGNLLVAEDQETAELYQTYLARIEQGSSPDSIRQANEEYLASRESIRNDGWALDRAFHMLVGNEFDSDEMSNLLFPGYLNSKKIENRGAQYNNEYQPIADDLIARGLMDGRYNFIVQNGITPKPGFDIDLRDGGGIDVTDIWDSMNGLDKTAIPMTKSFLGRTTMQIFDESIRFETDKMIYEALSSGQTYNDVLQGLEDVKLTNFDFYKRYIPYVAGMETAWETKTAHGDITDGFGPRHIFNIHPAQDRGHSDDPIESPYPGKLTYGWRDSTGNQAYVDVGFFQEDYFVDLGFNYEMKHLEYAENGQRLMNVYPNEQVIQEGAQIGVSGGSVGFSRHLHHSVTEDGLTANQMYVVPSMFYLTGFNDALNSYFYDPVTLSDTYPETITIHFNGNANKGTVGWWALNESTNVYATTRNGTRNYINQFDEYILASAWGTKYYFNMNLIFPE